MTQKVASSYKHVPPLQAAKLQQRQTGSQFFSLSSDNEAVIDQKSTRFTWPQLLTTSYAALKIQPFYLCHFFVYLTTSTNLVQPLWNVLLVSTKPNLVTKLIFLPPYAAARIDQTSVKLGLLKDAQPSELLRRD